VYPPKKTHQKTHPKNPPHLKCIFVFCATNNEVYFIVFKAFKPMTRLVTTEFIFCKNSKIIGADVRVRVNKLLNYIG